MSAHRSSLAWALGLALLGCQNEEQKPTFTTRERSQVVEAGPSAAVAPPPSEPAAAAPSAAAPPKKKRRLCGDSPRADLELSDKKISRAAKGASSLPEKMPAPGGRYSWVNFWAAWCGPCKEEIPLLLSWERELGAKNKLRVLFISLDDDERQLQAFLDSSAGLKDTYWLREGSERADWMKDVGLETDPELPAHLLVDPKGKIRCVVRGAIDESDHAELVKLVGG